MTASSPFFEGFDWPKQPRKSRWRPLFAVMFLSGAITGAISYGQLDTHGPVVKTAETFVLVPPPSEEVSILPPSTGDAGLAHQ